MRKQQLLAVAILAAVGAWMALPHNAETANLASLQTPTRVVVLPEGLAESESPGVVTVRAERISQQSYTEKIRVRGQTQAFRHVEIRAEEAGRVIGEPVARGARVQKGDLLCEIAIDNRQVNLDES